LRLDALIAIGGEDTLGVGRKLADLGAPVIGIPKTIDKDLSATDYTLGFDTSVRTVVDIIEPSKTPAGSHPWVQGVEVMGLAGGAYMILIPEHPFGFAQVKARLDERLAGGDRKGPRSAVVVVAEGAVAEGGDNITVDGQTDEFGHKRLGGVGSWLAERIREDSDHDARSVALGHPQRGGPPSPVDWHMGWLYGIGAVEAALRGAWGQMVSARGIAPACDIRLVKLADAVARLNLVDVPRYYDTERLAPRRSVLDSSTAYPCRSRRVLR